MGDFLTTRLPFGLVFTAFALFWMATASWMGQKTGEFDLIGQVFPLFGIPFVLTGLYLMIGMPLWDAFERSHSWYALSDQAAYIATEIFGRRKLKRYPIADMDALELEDGAIGTVWFNREMQVYRKTRRRPGGAGMRRTYVSTTKTGFKRIETARSVYGLLVRQMNKLGQSVSG